MRALYQAWFPKFAFDDEFPQCLRGGEAQGYSDALGLGFFFFPSYIHKSLLKKKQQQQQQSNSKAERDMTL